MTKAADSTVLQKVAELTELALGTCGFNPARTEEDANTGPVIIPQIWVPDLNAVNNRGGVVFLLYKDRNGTEVNVEPKLLSAISDCFGDKVRAELLALYNYGVLGTGV